MRTDAGRDAPAAVRAAAAVVGSDPVLWLLGIVGFGVRGGLVLLTLPILTIPSPILLSILFRGELGTAGTNASFDLLAFVAAAITGGVALVAILISAWAEVQAVERCVAAQQSSVLRLGRPPRELPARERHSLLLWVAAVQAAGLVPLLLLALMLVGRVTASVSSELQQPSDLDLPLIARVIRDSAPALLGLVLAIACADVLVSLGTRRLIVARLGLLPDGAGERTEGRLAIGGATRLLRQPARVLGVALLSWSSAALALAVALGGLTLTWGTARDGLLALAREDQVGPVIGGLIIAAMLSAVWLTALGLCGLVSAFRSSLWTMDTLR